MTAYLQNNLSTIDGWQIIEKTFDPEAIVTTGSNFMIGNGGNHFPAFFKYITLTIWLIALIGSSGKIKHR